MAREFDRNREIRRKKPELSKVSSEEREDATPVVVFERKIETKKTEDLLIDRFLSEENPPLCTDRRSFQEVAQVLQTVAPNDLVDLTDALLRNVKKEDDEFWTIARKEGARRIISIVPLEIKKEAQSRLRNWHSRADELAILEEKTNAEIASILEDEGYETNQGNIVSSMRIKDYLSKQRSEGVSVPKREIAWHIRAKEISGMPPAARAQTLAEEGYTTRDGNSISENAINVYLSGARAKGEALPRSESSWHQRANELRSEGKTVPEIAKTLAEEGYQTNRKKAISSNALYVYFSRKKSEDESSEENAD